MPLRPHQEIPAKKLLEILRATNSALDMSDCGIGKTYIAAWVASQLRIPTLVVCPLISISAWHRAASAFGDTLSVINYESLRTGRSQFGHWDCTPKPREMYFQCVNCQRKFSDGEVIPPCYCHPGGIHGFETRKKPARLGKFNFHPGVRFVIFDEVHRSNGLNSQNADLLIAAKRGNLKILGLSATPASSPLHLRALGYALDLHKLGDFYSWMGRYGVRRIPGCGFKWAVSRAKQAEVMAAIRASIIPERGIRVRKIDIPDFPGCDISAELYDLHKGGRIDELYKSMAQSIAQLRSASLSDKSPEHPLTKILRARQEIELLKVPVVEELVADLNAKGFSVAVFVNFAQTIAELSKRLNTTCIVDGSANGVKNRVVNIENFQTNSEPNIILNSEAGGVSVSLDDRDGEHPRVGLVFPGFSATTMRQVFGRLPRHGGKSRSFYRVIFAAKTVESQIYTALKPKLDNLDALTDADLSPENLHFAP